MQRILETGCLVVAVLCLTLVVACEDEPTTDEAGGTGGAGASRQASISQSQ